VTTQRKLDDLLGKARRFAREWTDQEGCNAHVLDQLRDAVVAYDRVDATDLESPALRKVAAIGLPLNVAELFTLLRAIVAWRTQGHISRWTTAPSVTLAKLVDRLLDEHHGEGWPEVLHPDIEAATVARWRGVDVPDVEPPVEGDP